MKKINILILISIMTTTSVVWAGITNCDSLTSGLWSAPSTWTNCNGTIPSNGAFVIIKSGHLVTLDVDTNQINSLNVNFGGDFDVAFNPAGLTIFSSPFTGNGVNIDLSNASINLSGNLTIDALGKDIMLGSVDGAFGLTLNSLAETRFTGIIGGTTPLTSLITDAAGTTVFADNSGGINSQNVKVNGVRQFNDPVLLAATTNIGGNSGTIEFNSTLDSETTAQRLYIIAQVTAISFNGDVGVINKLSSFDIFNSFNSTMTYNLDQFLTTGYQNLNVDIVLDSPNNSVFLNSSSAGNIILGSTNTTVRSQTAGTESLSISTDGTVTINATIGDNSQGLSDFTINSSSTATINSTSITGTGTQVYSGPIVFGVNNILTAGIVDMQSTVDNGGFDLTINNSDTVNNSQISGMLSGSGNLIKEGLAQLDISSATTLTGNLIINQGTVHNTTEFPTVFIEASGISIAQGAIADIGSLTAGNLNLSAQSLIGKGYCDCNISAQAPSTISPGFSPGILSTNGMTMVTGSQLNIELNGTIAGTDYDQLSVSSINLDQNSDGGATLNVTLGYTPQLGDTFVIVDQTGGSPVINNFNGLPEGSQFTVGLFDMVITYTGGDSNDIQLTVQSSNRYYVDADAAASGDGFSWNSALNNLQDALAVATSGEVWVADGIYTPDVNGGDPLATFTLNNGIKLYGGFNGTETNLSQRDPAANLTIISGDLDNDDSNKINGVTTNYSDLVGTNSYHLITSLNTDNSTLIDGFTLTAGWAAGAMSIDQRGSAVYCNNSTLKMNDIIVQGNRSNNRAALWSCTSEISQSSFINNFAGDVGAVSASGGTYTDVIFTGNLAATQGSLFYLGGGMLNLTRVKILGNGSTGSDSIIRAQSVTLNFNDVLFSGNKYQFGGLDLSSGTNGSLNNMTITGNLSQSPGASIKSTIGVNPLNINNSIIWNNQNSAGMGTTDASITHTGTATINFNSSILQGSGGSTSWNPTTLVNGGGNLDVDPLFISAVDPNNAPTTLGNLRLQPTSMAIDTGDNSFLTSTQDLDGLQRIRNSFVDMGAYEYFVEQVFIDGFE